MDTVTTTECLDTSTDINIVTPLLNVSFYALTRKNTVMRCAEPRAQITLLGTQQKSMDRIQADYDDYSEHDDSPHQYGNEWQTDDFLAFLSRFWDNDPDNSPGYHHLPDSAPTRATAFMIGSLGPYSLPRPSWSKSHTHTRDHYLIH
jgi:hypothetical protein